MSELALKHGLSFSDLYERDGLVRLDRAFVAHLAAAEVALHDRLMLARAAPDALDRKAESDLLVDKILSASCSASPARSAPSRRRMTSSRRFFR